MHGRDIGYFDTSALAKWYLHESFSDNVERYLTEHGPVAISWRNTFSPPDDESGLHEDYERWLEKRNASKTGNIYSIRRLHSTAAIPESRMIIYLFGN